MTFLGAGLLAHRQLADEVLPWKLAPDFDAVEGHREANLDGFQEGFPDELSDLLWSKGIRSPQHFFV